VTLARWNGGDGNSVILDVGGGVRIVHGRSSKPPAHEGQRVQAGDPRGRVGDTGHSFGPHLHVDVRIAGRATDRVQWMKAHGVDIPSHFAAVYGRPANFRRK
jgi:murein DD-endopeptidase MepM/ murein hydrolase activator NlpD